MNPGEGLHRIILFPFHVLRIGFQSFGDSPKQENLVLIGQMDHSVDVGRNKNLTNTVEDRMVCFSFDDNTATAL